MKPTDERIAARRRDRRRIDRNTRFATPALRYDAARIVAVS